MTLEYKALSTDKSDLKQKLISILDNPIFLILILILTIYFWYSDPRPFIASDPGAYSRLSSEIALTNSIPTTENHIFNHRLGLLIPTAIFYKLFGINSATTHLWPLLCSLLVTCLIWFVIPKKKARFFACLLWSMNPIQHRFIVSLFPDIGVSAFMFSSAVSLYYRHSSQNNISKQVLLGASGAISLFVAFFFKASAYWVLPFWLLVVSFDIRHRRFLSIFYFYLTSLLFFSLLFLGYLYVCDILWGDPFARIKSIQALEGLHTWTLKNRSIMTLAKRLTYKPFFFLIITFIPSFALSVASFFSNFKSNLFWKIYFLLNLIIWWFGSTSLSFYEPLPLVPRMALPLLPPMCILSGFYLNDTLRILKTSNLKLVAVSFLVPLLILFSTIIYGATFPHISLPIFLSSIVGIVCLVLIGVISIRNISHLHTVSLVLVIPLCVTMFFSTDDTHHRRGAILEKDVIEKTKTQIHSFSGRTLILCSDQRGPEVLAYYLLQQKPADITILEFDSKFLAENIEKYDNIAFYINKNRAQYLKRRYHEKTYEVEMNNILKRKRSKNAIKKGGISICWLKRND